MIDDLTAEQLHSLRLIENLAANGASKNDRRLLEHTIKNGIHNQRTLKDWLAEMKSKRSDSVESDIEKAVGIKAKLRANIK